MSVLKLRPLIDRAKMFGLGDEVEALQSRIKELERERDEALQLTESCSTLKDMASACIDGAVWKHDAEKAEARIKELEAKVQLLEEYIHDIESIGQNI